MSATLKKLNNDYINEKLQKKKIKKIKQKKVYFCRVNDNQSLTCNRSSKNCDCQESNYEWLLKKQQEYLNRGENIPDYLEYNSDDNFIYNKK